MAHMVLFDEAFNAADSCLQLPPARTKNGRASPFPVLEPSRPHVAHSHRMICLAHDNYLDNQERSALFKLGPKSVWEKLCANTKAQSAWLRIMLQGGIVTADEILDQSDIGLVRLYRKTVTTQNAAIAVRVLEHWFTGCPSGAQGLLSRISQELHRNGVILHSLYGDGAGGRNVRQRVSPAAVPAPTVRLPKMHRTALVASTGALAQTFADWFDADIGSGYSALKAKYHDAPWSLRKRWCKELAKDSDSD